MLHNYETTISKLPHGSPGASIIHSSGQRSILTLLPGCGFQCSQISGLLLGILLQHIYLFVYTLIFVQRLCIGRQNFVFFLSRPVQYIFFSYFYSCIRIPCHYFYTHLYHNNSSILSVPQDMNTMYIFNFSPYHFHNLRTHLRMTEHCYIILIITLTLFSHGDKNIE